MSLLHLVEMCSAFIAKKICLRLKAEVRRNSAEDQTKPDQNSYHREMKGKF